MTTYSPPDYNVALEIAFSDFRCIVGVGFDVTIVHSKNKRHIPGMLIIPEVNDFPEASSTATAWLWLDDCPNMLEGTRIKITVGEPCDPMLSPEKHTAMANHTGLGIGALVIRNWNTEQADPSDA
ncbi:hypothetical protein [Desulforhopalus sp. 52FAK]